MKLLTNSRLFLSLLIIVGLCVNGYHFQINDNDDEDTGSEETNPDEEASGNGPTNSNNNEDQTNGLLTERINPPTKQSVVVTTGAVNLDETVNGEQQSLDDISDSNDNDANDDDSNDDVDEEEEDLNDSSQTNNEESETEQIANKPSADVSSTIVTPPFKSSRSKLLSIISKPGILAGIVGGAIIGILTAVLLIMFIVYRMRKKDEGSYALEETKKPLNAYDYRHCPTKEFYA